MYSYLTWLRKRLENANKPVGTFLELGNLRILDAVYGTGIDFVVLDNMKGVFDDKTLQTKTKAALIDYRLPALVRTKDASLDAVAQAENLHTAGLIVPRVTELEQVTAIINKYKAFPLGLKYQDLIPHDPLAIQALERWNEQLLLFLECDNAFLYDHLETVTAWEGIDGIYVNPSVLFHAVKSTRPTSMTDLPNMLEQIKTLCKERGKFCIVYEDNGDNISNRLTWGHYDAVIYSSDLSILRYSYLSIADLVFRHLHDDD